MEDRITPGLYLEMGDGSVDDHRRRAAAVLRQRGAHRATAWENVVPGRTDLPRRLPEFGLLSVYEVDHSFDPPSDGGLHFGHYPRPAQGRLTGRPTIGLSLVLISPKHAEQAQALRDWGDFVHLHHIAAVGVPGYTMITPYENVTGGEPRFLHFYEMDTDDPETSFQEMTRLVVRRLGDRGTPEFDEWAWHPELRIDYVNTFRLVDELPAHA